MPQCSYNNVIIALDITMSEFLSARFVHPGPPQLTILYF